VDGLPFTLSRTIDGTMSPLDIPITRFTECLTGTGTRASRMSSSPTIFNCTMSVRDVHPMAVECPTPEENAESRIQLSDLTDICGKGEYRIEVGRTAIISLNASVNGSVTV
jgi:hypothetical protein